MLYCFKRNYHFGMGKIICSIFAMLILNSFIITNSMAADHSASITTSGNIEINSSGLGNGISIAADNLTVTSTCHEGYNLTISTSTSDNNLYLDGDSTHNTEGEYFAPTTGEAALTNSSNRWGFIMSNSAPTAQSVFQPVPALGNTTTIRNTFATPSDKDILDSFPVYYGTSTTSTLGSGAYKMVKDTNNQDGAIVYMLTLNPTCADSYNISFNENLDGEGGEGTDDTLENFPTSSDNTIEFGDITISDKVPTRSGYAFVEWNTEQDRTGNSYTPGEEIKNGTSGLSGNVTLYAIWRQSDGTLYMQDVQPHNCTEDAATTVIDKRDNTSYTIQRLEDGKCWMTKNLDLAGGTTLSSDTTDMDASWTLPTGNGFQADNKLPESSTTGFSGNSTAYVYNTENATDNCTGAGCYSYYSWIAATLGSTTVNTSNTDAPYSICPKNWHLPNARSNDAISDAESLNYAYSYGDSFYAEAGLGTAANFLLTGAYDQSAATDQDVTGYFWTATVSGRNRAYRFSFDNDASNPTSNPANSVNRRIGAPVRCILTEPQYNVTVDFTNSQATKVTFESDDYSTVTATTTSNTVTLKRGVEYTITATIANDYRFTNWSTTANGFINTATDNPTTYTIRNTATLTPNTVQLQDNTVTVNMDSNTTSVTFTNSTYGTETASTSGDTVTLKEGVPYTLTATYNTGYGIREWIIDSNATITSSTISIPDYTVNGTTTLSATSERILPLQNWGGCYAMDVGSTMKLLDTRDNQVYQVGRYFKEVGGCWMLDNLALDLTDANVVNNMDETNTNASNTTLNYLKNGGGTTSDQYATAGLTYRNWVRNNDESYSAPLLTNAYRNRTTANDTLNPDAKNWRYGIYYNFCAASAGSYCYGEDDWDMGTPSGNSATEDICPAGWSLPTYFGYNYITTYRGTPLEIRNAMHLPLSDIVADGSILSDAGKYGYWWHTEYDGAEALTQDPDLMGDLEITNTSATADDSTDRLSMLPIRCTPIFGTADPQLVTATFIFDSNVRSISAYNSYYGTQTITTSGSTLNLRQGVKYTITASFNDGYTTDYWSTDANGILDSTTTTATRYTVMDPSTLTLVSTNQKCGANMICYEANATDAVGTMGKQSISSPENPTLIAPNFSRAGYGFSGWNTKPDGTGTQYGPNETIVKETFSSEGLKLYAQWVASSGSLQSWQGCPSMAINDVIALTDTRDGNVYTIAKLADSKCWMTENLRLDTSGSDNRYLSQGFGGAFTGLANAESSNFSESSTANSKYSTSSITGDNQDYRFPRYNNSNTTSRASSPATADANLYSYGNYYTWPAAIASTEDYSYNDPQNVYGTSICPVGWHLPTAQTDGEFDKLNQAINGGSTDSSAGLRRFPANLVYSGTFDNSSATHRSSIGEYWASTSAWYMGGYNLTFEDDEVGGFIRGTTSTVIIDGEEWEDDSELYLGENKYTGAAVRCVADSEDTVKYPLQNQTAASLAALMPNTEDTAKLYDTRDGKVYTVEKLADGRYWMLDNLELELANPSVLKNVTPENTNATAPSIKALNEGNRSAGARYAEEHIWEWRNRTKSYSPSIPLVGSQFRNDTLKHQVPEGKGSHRVGIYYNYCAASAGSYCYGTGVCHADDEDQSNVCDSGYGYGSPSGNATEDICPSTWHMPSVGSQWDENDQTDYGILIRAYGLDVNRVKTALSIVDAALYHNNSNARADYELGASYIWSSTYENSANTSTMWDIAPTIDNYNAHYFSGSSSRTYGQSVRCIFGTQ